MMKRKEKNIQTNMIITRDARFRINDSCYISVSFHIILIDIDKSEQYDQNGSW